MNSPARTSPGQTRQQQYDRANAAVRQDVQAHSGQSRSRQLDAISNAVQHQNEQARQRGLDQVWPAGMGREGDRWSYLPYMRPDSDTQPAPATPGEDLPFVFEQHDGTPSSSNETVRPTAPPRTASFAVRPDPKPDPTEKLRYVPAAPDDRTRYRLAPIRELPISAPIQPRVVDMRVHMERDAQSAVPAFDVSISFRFSMQPGQLQ